MAKRTTNTRSITIGMDLGDKHTQACILKGDHMKLESLRTTPGGLRRFLAKLPGPATVVIEVGTHSPWISRLIQDTGHHVIVANPRNVRLIAEGHRKNDQVDAELLARIGRLDPKLLSPIQHRGAQAHADLLLIRARDALVRARTRLINTIRGTAKSFGVALPRCSPSTLVAKVLDTVPEQLQPVLTALCELVVEHTKRIRRYHAQIARLQDDYPELPLLTQVPGVGPITSAAFLLTIEDPDRFKKSRAVGAYLGLTPAQRKSGERDPHLRITKRGSPLLRKLLVLSAQHILQESSPDSALKASGLAIVARGGKRAKKRAVVAVARKLAVILHGLWKHGRVYDPNHCPKHRSQPRAAS
jgi:transposase